MKTNNLAASSAPGWLLLVTSLPTRNATARMRLWRSVKALGCATLRDGVYLLPANDVTREAFAALAEETRAADGEAQVLQLQADAAQQADFRQRFDRSADYAPLLEKIRQEITLTNQADPAATAPATAARRLTALRRELAALARQDYFPGAAQQQAEALLEELVARFAALTGEPGPLGASPRRLARADYQKRCWATRRDIWVDRLASAWLIRAHIDPAARFLWLERTQDCPSDAVGFDFDGATFSHAGPRVTFETLLYSFALDHAPELARLGALVHFLDAGGAAPAEAAGFAAVLHGLKAAARDDDHLLTLATPVLEGLCRHFLEASRNRSR